jgi:hypothetical protein
VAFRFAEACERRQRLVTPERLLAHVPAAPVALPA